jgi:hypothetical protein
MLRASNEIVPDLKHGRRTLGALLFFVALAVAHTWPLATDPARLSRNDNLDTKHNEWIISWIAHQLPHDPLHLFDANKYYPERYALAYSPPLLIQGLLGAPIRWLGGSPVLTFNLVLLMGMALTALAMYHLTVTLTHDHLAGLLSGSLLAFNAHTLTRLPHLQAHFAAGIPLVVLAFERLLTGKSTREAVWLGLLVALQTLCSGYLGVFAAIAVGVSLVARVGECWGMNVLRLLSRVGLAALVSAAVASSILWPYFLVRSEMEISSSLQVAQRMSATLNDYLSTAARLHSEAWSRPFYDKARDCLFPGVVPVSLGVFAVLSSKGIDGMRIFMFVSIGLVGIVLSLGPVTPLHAFLFEVFPPVRLLRTTSRFGFLLLFALAALAGYGVARLRKHFPRSLYSRLAVGVMLLLANLEVLRAPMSYVPFEGISPIYRVIADAPAHAVVAEMPLYPSDRTDRNASYLLASTEHWKPLLNGSGFPPESYRRRAPLLRDFPSPESIRELRRARVTHVVVHLERYAPARARRIQDALEKHPEFFLAASDPAGILLYQLR